jgi:SAM-dependent methyltransferase
MAVSGDALVETAEAFDSVARTYSGENERNLVLQEMRRRARAKVVAMNPPGCSLLDLGCGPGDDALHFARKGFHVTAIDWSEEMVREAQRRVEAEGLEGRIEVHHIGIHELEKLEAGRFQCAYSNLGPLNCVPDLGAAAAKISARLSSKGTLVASVISRICPWEILLYGLRGSFGRVRVRFSRELVRVPFYGRSVWTRYYSPSELEEAFGQSGFARVHLEGLGVFLPPPYLSAFAERHPTWFYVVRRLEERIASWPLARRLGDHFLISFRKR